ncbi:hypothetical protein GGI20_002743 [Coemansia sp. BCRC 34301]|nr:hypothetical protein GGI20_002743 [Coemansia sp. BCRC 34301]
MNISFIPLACFATAALAQINPVSIGLARQAPTYLVAGQAPRIPQAVPPPSTPTQSLLSRLASYFDISRLSGVDTTMPVMVTHALDPKTSKLTSQSMNVVQSGNVLYIPVCTLDSITAAGSAAAPSAPESCKYGIKLAPVPQNAMRTKLQIAHAMVGAIQAAAMEPTRFWVGRQSTGMTTILGIPRQ